MEATIDRWKSFLPQLGGIFFDEQSNQAKDVASYQTLSQYAKAQGLSYPSATRGPTRPKRSSARSTPC